MTLLLLALLLVAIVCGSDPPNSFQRARTAESSIMKSSPLLSLEIRDKLIKAAAQAERRNRRFVTNHLGRAARVQGTCTSSVYVP